MSVKIGEIYQGTEFGQKHSAGILVYRVTSELQVEHLLVRAGGPWYAHYNDENDQGVWSIPKGEINTGEVIYECALREFGEETSAELPKRYKDERMAICLGTVRQKSGKIVHAWAVCADLNTSVMKSNLFHMEWPKGSGRMGEFPEVDHFEYFNTQKAKVKINQAQLPFIDAVDSMVSKWYKEL